MERQPELTSLRGVAALWVFIYHIPIYLGFASLNIPLVSCGYLGVPIFLMLSMSLLLRSLDENDDLKRYFVRRIKRIWPTYFFTVLLVFFYYSHNLTWLAEQLSFSAVFIDNQSIQYVFWTLQIEEVAYIFFPLIHRLSTHGKFALGVFLYSTGLLTFFAIVWLGQLASLWWLPPSLASYGMGILVYLKRSSLYFFPLLLVAPFYWDTVMFVMASVLIIPGLSLIVQHADRIQLLRSKPLVFLGDVSYELYMIHPIALSALGFLGTVAAIPMAWAVHVSNGFLLRKNATIKVMKG